EPVGRVVVAAGGSDRDGLAIRIALAARAEITEASVAVVVGPWGIGDVPDGLEVIRAIDGLGPVIAKADLIATAGGVTMLEALALGRPTVAFAVALNQRQAV